MTELEFHPLSLDEYETVYNYMSAFGEGSCQHSFTTLFALYEKYGDEICIRDGVLYVLRSHLSGEGFRVYLAPFGSGDLTESYKNILDDAHRYNARVKFTTLTESASRFVTEHFPDLFEITPERDLAEYVYKTEAMSTLAGGKLARIRAQCNQFRNTYGDRLAFSALTSSDHEEILALEKQWLTEYEADPEFFGRDLRAVRRQLDNFEALHFTGITMRLDGKLIGFIYGTGLNADVYDAFVGKTSSEVPGTQRVMWQEFFTRCAAGFKYVNLEEDLGSTGLRNVKLLYHPEYLIDKFTAIEKAGSSDNA